MAKQTSRQKAKVEQVMHAYKEGDLNSGSGRKVTNPKQAVAIALHEAGVPAKKAPARRKG